MEAQTTPSKGSVTTTTTTAQVLLATPPSPSLSQRRPLLIQQESAEASPNIVDFTPKKQFLLPDSPITPEKARKLNSFKSRLEKFLEVEDVDGHLEVTAEDSGEEEGIGRIARSTFKLEVLLWFGVLLCIDQVVTWLTTVPLRLLYTIATQRTAQSKNFVFDAACLSIFVLSLAFLSQFVGAAQVYHSIRLQTFMKLYVVINITEVLDRLLSSLGLDLYELLADASRPGKKRGWVFGIRFILCLGYTCLHCVLFYVRLLTLSVAINSSNDALFTILVSNNFVELKGSVFKRSTEQNLFQIACSDIVERFVLICFMILVGLNEFETRRLANEKEGGTFIALILLILLAEVFVDWIKHMFIVRFNSDIQVKDVYDRFLGVLAEDFVGKPKSSEEDSKQAKNIFPSAARRLGLPILPLATLIARVVVFDIADMLEERAWWFILKGWIVSIGIKVAVKFILSKRAPHLIAQPRNVAEEDESAVSEGSRPPSTIGLPPTPRPETPATPTPSKSKTMVAPTMAAGKEILLTPIKYMQKSQITTPQQQTPPPKSSSKKSVPKSLDKVSRFENS